MARVTFDTNIFISRRRVDLPKSFYLSVVVLQELVAGARDDAEVKVLNAVLKEYEKLNRLIVPTAEDWWLAGKAINALQRGLKSQQGGVAPKMSTDQKHRIIHDVLIARTAKRAGITNDMLSQTIDC
jgi:predicted nucleic acid-binding protein